MRKRKLEDGIDYYIDGQSGDKIMLKKTEGEPRMTKQEIRLLKKFSSWFHNLTPENQDWVLDYIGQ